MGNTIGESTYFDRFSDDDLIEIRCINLASVKRHWIHPADYPSLKPEFLQLNNDGYNIFASVNPRCCQSSKEEAIISVVAFHADIDCPGGHSCFAAKRTQRKDKATPLPTLVVTSGHGFHLYWHLAVPVSVTPANRPHLKAINRGLSLSTGGDPACCDLARILRIPGFINHKPPAQPVQLVAHRPVTYTLEELAPFAAVGPTAKEIDLGDIPEMTDDLKERFAEARSADKSGQMRRAWRGEIGDGSSDSRYVLIKMLTESAQFTPEEIVVITCDRTWYNKKSKQLKDPELVREDAIRLVGKLA